MSSIDFLVCVRCFTFNHAPYIEDAMNGFCMQDTDFPFVCVIVDDASTDGEPDVIKNYLKIHFDLGDKLTVRNEKTNDYLMTFAQHKINKNCYFAVYFLAYNHYSIKKNKFPYFSEYHDNAKYIALCEGDDYWIDSKKLQKQVSYLDSHADYSMIHTRFNYKNEKNGQLKSDSLNDELIKDILSDKSNMIAYYILKNNAYRIQTMSVLFRRENYDKIKSFEIEERNLFMMGDTQLWLNLLQTGKIKYLPEVTSVYRLSEASASRANSKLKRIRFSLSCEEMRLFYSRKLNLRDNLFYKNYIKTLFKYLIFQPDYRSDKRIVNIHDLDIFSRFVIRIGLMRFFGWLRFFIK